MTRLWLGFLPAGDFVQFHGHHFEVDVDAVEEGTGNFRHVAVNRRSCAAAFLRGMIVVTAGTGVHGGDQHKIRGIIHGVSRPADGDFAVFQRLAHHFEHRPLVFGQFVQEQDAVRGKGNLAGAGEDAAADEGDARNRMVRRPEGASGDERAVAGQFARHGVYLRGFQGLLSRRHGRQDAGKAARQHGLSRTGRTHHDDVVHPRGRTSRARFTFSCPLTSLKSYMAVSSGISREGSKRQGAWEAGARR